MKKLWNEYFRYPVGVIVFSHLAGFGFFFGVSAAARILNATVVIGYAP